MLYSTLEVDSGIICSCLPVMAPLLRYVPGVSLTSSREFSEPKKYSSRNGRLYATESLSRLNDDGMRHDAERQNKVHIVGTPMELGLMSNNQIHVTNTVDIECGDSKV